MALKHFILALLSIKPASGYGLHKSTLKPVRPSLPQVYRAIGELYSTGAIKRERIHNKLLPSQNIYEVTNKGYKELERWFNDPIRVSAMDEPELLKIWFGNTCNKKFDQDIVNRVLDAFIAKRTDELNYYENEALRTIKGKKTKSDYPEQLYRRLVIDYFKSRAKNELQWAMDAKKKVSDLSNNAYTASH